jgi:hydrogenase nickel incorporation protein HypA/HybF
MHELSIAHAVLEAVRTEALRLNGRRPAKVGVRMGELAAVDPEALRFCFEALVRESDLDSMQIEIEFCPRRHRCSQCENVFAVANFSCECPVCGSADTRFVSGDELELAYLEVEEDESLALGR